MILPRLPSDIQKNRREIVELRGVNYTDSFADGDLAYCKNLSARRWPYLSARRARERLPELDGSTALTAWEKLVCVRGTGLLYDGQKVGTVTAGEKQFAVVNTRLVIWPDQVYLDLQSKALRPLGAKASGTGASFAEDGVTVDRWPDLTGLFSPGDTVTVSGCTAQTANNKDIQVKAVSKNKLTVAKGGFAAGSESGSITIERHVPELDFICESENRLWGCCNKTRTIYASALGDPSNFFTYEGLSTDGYAVAVGSEGEFTGCCKLSGGVLFWKERTLHKLLGSFPAEYAMYTYSVEGLKKGCHKSMQVVNETLYYLGAGGVYAYAGGSPRKISPGLDGLELEKGVAGTDGERYYLSAESRGQRHLFVCDLESGLWLREDETRCVDFARVGGALYFLTDTGQVWRADSGAEDSEVEWEARFTPFCETIQGRKRYSRLLLRLELERVAWARAQVRCDGGQWETCGQWFGEERDVVCPVLPIRRCDKFELRLTGKGSCAVLGISREFSVGSER